MREDERNADTRGPGDRDESGDAKDERGAPGEAHGDAVGVEPERDGEGHVVPGSGSAGGP